MNDEQSAQLLATLHEIQIELSAISSKLSDVRKNTNDIRSVNDGVKRITEIVGALGNVGVS